MADRLETSPVTRVGVLDRAVGRHRGGKIRSETEVRSVLAMDIFVNYSFILLFCFSFILYHCFYACAMHNVIGICIIMDWCLNQCG